MKTTILVACHKPYDTPKQPCYVPIQVGAALSGQTLDGMIRDDTGDNISGKNRSFCELTALYWAWKNLDSEAILFELEKRLDISDYDAYSKRVFGFVSERLIDCWLETNHIPYADMPVVFMENQHWPGKICRFLQRKIVGSLHSR